MRLIDADAVIIEWYRINNIDENDRGARFVGYTEIPRLLNHMPTINAEPVKHGEWECSQNKEYCIRADFKALVCSICGCNIPNVEQIPKNYCPNCGADMRKKGGGDHETD